MNELSVRHSPPDALAYRLAWLLSTLTILICIGSMWVIGPEWSLDPLIAPTWHSVQSLLPASWLMIGAPLICSLALLLCAEPLPTRRAALMMLLLALLLFALWPVLLLRLDSPLAALLDIGVSWLLCLGCIASTARLNAAAGWCLLPVFAWVSYAVVLNGVVVALN